MGDQEQLQLADLFHRSCRTASEYPYNLVFPRDYEHQLKEYLDQLDRKADEIFCIDSKTVLEFFELDSPNDGFETASVYTYGDLDSRLRLHQESCDPLCRYIFINAPNARAKLKTDRDMFVRILSYHQVMPSFLDFVFSFGKQERAKDFHFCGFRSESKLYSDIPLLRLPNLRRSGRILEMCYSLRSVEKASQAHWPWSVRQCAVYHSYDVETEVATWIVIKANKLMKTRIKSLVKKGELYGVDTVGAESSPLQSALRTHVLIASWSAEQWRWYINFLEERFEQTSGQTLTESTDLASVKREVSAHRAEYSSGAGSERETESSTSFDLLQDIHYIEERTDEALLVVKADSDVLLSLETFYNEGSVELRRDGRPEDCRQDDIESFSRELRLIRKELTMQQHRLETLVRLIQGRKSLVHLMLKTSQQLRSVADCLQLRSMLQHRNIMMNFVLASEAQTSARHVERMTKEMHSIARSTKLETVSMRIITFVTLVYLPGTFVSTLMSTPVVTFEPADFSKGHRHVDLDALKLFSAMSVPLLLFTVAVWWFFKWREGQKDNISEDYTDRL